MNHLNLLMAIGLLLSPKVYAWQSNGSGTDSTSARPIDYSVVLAAGYPAAPVSPEVITRDAQGRATIRAVRLSSPLTVDGKIEEKAYSAVRAVSDFIQQEPNPGQPATEKTEVWFFFDDDNIYLVARCWDSQPERMVANEMRRDGSRIPRNENLAMGLDTFFDHRNGYNFEFTPVGGRMDGEIANDGATTNSNWNGVWQHAAARFEQGWAVEARIPFKTLRYKQGGRQVWAWQVRRIVRWKNEISFITRIPPSVGERGHMRLSLAPAVVDLEVPRPTMNLEVKPFTTTSLSSDTAAKPQIRNDFNADWGVDLKYGVTRSLTADFTYNTDFAQVEADLQQTNLTRFNLNFPEKREFFLENSGVFAFGGATGTGTTGIFATGSGASGSDNTPALFYSRRIGLAGADVVPIVGGARLSGRAGPYSIGLLSIVSDDVPAANLTSTNFGVARVRRDILRRSYVGAILSNRTVDERGVGSNQAFGVDAGLNLGMDFIINAFLAKTRTSGRDGEDLSYKGSFEYAGDRYGLLAEYLSVDRNFNPGVGFVRRLDMRRSFGQFRFSPRPGNPKSAVRKYWYTGNAEIITNSAGQTENITFSGELKADFRSGDIALIRYSHFNEFTPEPIRLSPNVSVPIGTYNYQTIMAGYRFGPQRKLWAAEAVVEYGTFYDGHKTTVTITNGLISFPPRLMVEPTYSLNSVDIKAGSFATNLLGPRVTYSLTPWAFISALVQYNSTTHTLSSNVRFRWEYQPGSELFIVWNEQHDTYASGLPLQNRALIVKLNRMWRR